MHRVEYLVVADPSKTKTKSIKSFKNLLQADDDIELTDKRFKVGVFEGDYTISKGNTSNPKHKGIYFHLTFICKKEEQIEAFVKALRSIRGSITLFSKQLYTVWDDVSSYYCNQAYRYINYIENLMRKLLNKFMLINLGMNWEKQRMPSDVLSSIHKDNKDFNPLNNLDFIKLSDFLFSKNYPKHKEDVFKKLEAATDSSEFDLDEIRSLLPSSNWTKYFGSIIECDGDFIKKRWEELYKLRNAVAHNKNFSLNDLNRVKELTNEVGEYLEAATNQLDEVIVPEDQIEDVVQDVVQENVKNYLSELEETERIVRVFYRTCIDRIGEPKLSIFKIIDKIVDKRAIDFEVIHKSDFESLKNCFKTKSPRGSTDSSIMDFLDDAIIFLRYIQTSVTSEMPYLEQYHLDKIKNPTIIEWYQQLKRRLLKTGLEPKINKHYIAFRNDTGNIIDIQLQQKGLKVWLNATMGMLKDPQEQTRDVSYIGHLGNGDYEITVTQADELEYVLFLADQVINGSRG